jgi:hypothetical protein
MEVQFFISALRKNKRRGCMKIGIFWRQVIISRLIENIFYKCAIYRVLLRFPMAADVSFPRLSLCRNKTGRYSYWLYYVRYSGMSSYSCTELIPFHPEHIWDSSLPMNVTLVRLLLTALRPKRWMWNDVKKKIRKVFRRCLYKMFAAERRKNPKRIAKKRTK